MTDALMEAHLRRPRRRLRGTDRVRLLLTGPGGFSWTLVLVILAFAWSLGLGPAWTEFFAFSSSDVHRVQGVVLDSGDLNMEINERTVSWVEFEYTTDDGPYTAVAYGSEYYPREGSKVAVEYLDPAPHVARVADQTRITKLGPVAMWVFAAALVVALFAAYRTLKALGWIRLLRSGRPARARLVEKSATSTTINEERVYALTFEYAAEDGHSHRFTTRRHRFEDITDDAEELVLHDPARSQTPLFVDELPFPLAPGPNGRWDYVGSGSLGASIAKRLALPLVIVGIGALF